MLLIPLLLGSAVVVGNMVIQIVAMVFVIRLLIGGMEKHPGAEVGLMAQTRALGIVVLVLFLGHVIQFGVWAWLFLYLGEFESYATAFYHSAVNFTSLGYGDIVMSERWRLLGALEAANGVLMFGLSAGAILSLMSWILRERKPMTRLHKDEEN